ncbi:MAG: hypothetical protein DRP47_01300 [Candidatus Zixiibacteriota bacterium]|nr:MAG: hypothetical protein DRP47_01300 [candidate division Zixibacteria bacterium]
MMISKLVIIVATIMLTSIGSLAETSHIASNIWDNRNPALTKHPDGQIKRLSIRTADLYSSSGTGGTVAAIDFQTFSVMTGFVATSQLTICNRFEIRDRDSLRYNWMIGGRLYLRNPDRYRQRSNPDGPIGGLVCDVHAGIRFFGNPDAQRLKVGDFSLSYPASSHLTCGIGYRLYEQKDSLDAIGTYGILNLYYAQYPSGYTWDNPDGPIGNLALRLKGGGSSQGFMTQAEFIFPLKSTLTLSVLLCYEQFTEKVRWATSIGGAIAWYPGN